MPLPVIVVLWAFGILAVSLLALFDLQSTPILSSGRAQRISASALLAQKKMAETLLKIDEGIAKGDFPDEKEEMGTFEEESLPDYSWKVNIRKVEIPAPPSIEGESEIMIQAFSPRLGSKVSKAVRADVKISAVKSSATALLLETRK